MPSKSSPLSLIIKHKMMIDVGHAQVEVVVYDEQLSETFQFFEYFNYANEVPGAVRRVVERAAKKAKEIKEQST